MGTIKVITKEDNLGYINKLYLTVCLPREWQNGAEGRKLLYNKEQEREKQKLSGWLGYIVNSGVRRKGNKYRAQDWLGVS